MDHVAPLDQPPTTGELLAGSLLSLFVPLVGFAIGAMWLERGGRSVAPGVASLMLACAGLGFWVAFTF